jgi:hypothetical protein
MKFDFEFEEEKERKQLTTKAETMFNEEHNACKKITTNIYLFSISKILLTVQKLTFHRNKKQINQIKFISDITLNS